MIADEIPLSKPVDEGTPLFLGFTIILLPSKKVEVAIVFDRARVAKLDEEQDGWSFRAWNGGYFVGPFERWPSASE